MGNQPSSFSSSSSAPPSHPSKKKNVTFAEHLVMTNDDETFATPITNQQHDTITPSLLSVERLQRENDALRDRCDRLEAQAILVAVQQLDVLAQGMAWTMYLLAMFVVMKCLLLLWKHGGNGTTWDEQLVHFVYHQLCWKVTCELTCHIQSQCQPTYEPWILWVIRSSWGGMKYILVVGMLYLYHWRSQGLDLRRCHVVAVALIMYLRISYCRARERLFLTTTTTTTTTNNRTDDDANNASTTNITPSLFGETMTEEAIWDANYEVSARFLYVSFRRLRGLWTKAAQYWSSRADFMPVAYVRELSKLQDQAPATPWHELMRARIIPASLLRLLHVEPIPIASASIGQVHVAHFIHSPSDKVCVKLQHPMAKTMLLDDFRSLRWICRLWTWLEPEYKFFDILMQEWATEARKELDFVQEAHHLMEAQDTLNQLLSMKQERQSHFVTMTHAIPYAVEIPQPILSLCTTKVLVMSYCEGVRLDSTTQQQFDNNNDDDDDENEWNIPNEDIMESVAQTFANFMYNGTIFHGDPHAGNLLLRPGIRTSKCVSDGGDHENISNDSTTTRTTKGFTLVLLDWGLAKRLSDTKRIAFAQMAYAAATMDFGLLLDSFDALGLKMKREDVHQDMDAIRFLLRESAPRSVARQRIKAKLQDNRAKSQSKKRGERVPVESKAYPGEFFFFVRVNELLHGLGSRLQVQLNYLDLIKPYAERALMHSQGATTSPKDDVAVEPFPIVDSELNAKVSEVLKELEATNQIAGAQVCVLEANGNALVDLAVGHLGGYLRQHAMRHDTLVLGFSCTKAVTATLAHVMVAGGYLTPDEPICERVWPNFCPLKEPPAALIAAFHDTLSEKEVRQRWAWKRKITLRHILTHSAGLWSVLPPRLTIQGLSSCSLCVAALEYDSSKPSDTILPNRAPGEMGEYHFLSFGWLVAGVVCGAYKERHGMSCTFEDVYEAILVPKLSAVTLSSGFKPNGSDPRDSSALVEIDDFKTRFLFQLEREAESMGDDLGDSTTDQKLAVPLLPTLQGREFLIDPRIWNCKSVRAAVCPAAGGRFSARGLAHFYHDLAHNGILSKERLEWASSVHMTLDNVLQGPTTMNSTNQERTLFGLGYQLIDIDQGEGSLTAFGHAGVGGSLGFYHKPSGASVAIMLNKADVEKSIAKTIVHAIAEHLASLRQ